MGRSVYVAAIEGRSGKSLASLGLMELASRRTERVGFFRPITLWPFPSEPLAEAAATAGRVAVLEQNAGQMIDDVRLAVLGRAPVVPIGGISSDEAGFGVGPLLDSDRIRGRIEAALAGREVAA